jgi:hypothetical protein
METQLKIIGAMFVGLAFMHVFFPRRFKWKEELSVLSLLTRQIMYVHTLFIALIILLMGLLCLSSAGDLLNTALGKRVLLGMAMFWGVRLMIQFVGYSSELWKGKRFETAIHIIFSIAWTYFTAVFAIGWWG